MNEERGTKCEERINYSLFLSFFAPRSSFFISYTSTISGTNRDHASYAFFPARSVRSG